MKKILLLALPIMVMCAVSCEKEKEEAWVDDSPIIQFKDPYFLEALLQKNWIDPYPGGMNGYYTVDVDRNNDGQISEKEASIVEALNLGEAVVMTGHAIRNTDELRYFTNLRYLSTDNRNLDMAPFESLNLSSLSKLEYLYCCQNNSLTSLDVSNNTMLKELHCNGNFASLDLSNNTALTELYCWGNQLTSLDLSNNTALEELWLREIPLTSVDLSNNTALRKLDCKDNQLTSLDLSNNTALTELDCKDNQLTSLDLSNNTALTELYCQGNQLTSLDLSNNTALTYLDCSQNKLTFLDLHNNKLLENLKLEHNSLQKLILYRYHILEDYVIEDIELEYGDIIEYME